MSLRATASGLVFLLLGVSAPVTAADDPLARLDDYLAKAMTAHKVPGLSVAAGDEGKVSGLKAPELAAKETEMKRSPRTADTPTVKLTDAELKRFIGKYESKVPPLDVEMEVVAGKLKATIGGGESATLAPVGKARFKVVGKPGDPDVFVQFDTDCDTVTAATVEQDKLKIKFMPKK